MLPRRDSGVGRSLDAVNLLNQHGSDIQRRWQPLRLAGREFCRRGVEGLEIVELLRHRFGGQVVPVTVRAVPRRLDGAAQISATAESELKRLEEAPELNDDWCIRLTQAISIKLEPLIPEFIV